VGKLTGFIGNALLNQPPKNHYSESFCIISILASYITDFGSNIQDLIRYLKVEIEPFARLFCQSVFLFFESQ
jgi:hypothetical protein